MSGWRQLAYTEYRPSQSMAEAKDSAGHTPLTPEWTPAGPAPLASSYPWRGDLPGAVASQLCLISWHT